MKTWQLIAGGAAVGLVFVLYRQRQQAAADALNQPTGGSDGGGDRFGAIVGGLAGLALAGKGLYDTITGDEENKDSGAGGGGGALAGMASAGVGGAAGVQRRSPWNTNTMIYNLPKTKQIYTPYKPATLFQDEMTLIGL